MVGNALGVLGNVVRHKLGGAPTQKGPVHLIMGVESPLFRQTIKSGEECASNRLGLGLGLCRIQVFPL